MTFTPQEQHDTLEIFSSTIRREAHVLASHPKLLWQQLYNRLQWEPGVTGALASAEYQKRVRSGGSRWLHLLSPYQESHSLLRTFAGHTKQVIACNFSPDGTQLVSASWDKTLKIWDVKSGLCDQTLVGNKAVHACCFSPDGKRIVSGGFDKSLIIWDARSGKAIINLIGHTGKINSCQYSPDGKQIISAGEDKSIKIWDASSGQLLRSLEGHDKEVAACKISPDGKFILSACDKSIWIWELASGAVVKELYPSRHSIKDCDFSPDGKRFMAASPFSIFVWEDFTKDPIAEIKLPRKAGTVRSCAFSPDNKRIIAAVDKSIYFWETESFQLIHKIDGHTGWINDVVYSLNGELVATASYDMTLRLWDPYLIDEEKNSSLEAKLGSSRFSTFSPDGRQIASVSVLNLKLWDSETGAIRKTLSGHKLSVITSAFSLKGDKIISSSHDKTVIIWDIKSGKSIQTLNCDDKTYTCQLSPDENFVAASSVGHQLWVWDSSSGSLRYNLKPQKGNKPVKLAIGSIHSPETTPGGSQDFCISPDGSLIISVNNKELLILNAETGEIERKFIDKSDFIKKCVFSPSGDQILTANSNAIAESYTLNLWDVKTGELIRKLSAHSGGIFSCQFSPDGKLILSTSEEKVMKIWDLASGEVILRLPHLGSILWAEFHPWKPHLLFCDVAGRVHRVECVGLTYAPVILTAFEEENKLMICCPACQREHPINQGQLGSEMTCPAPDCGLQIKLNPFIIKSFGMKIPLNATLPPKTQAEDRKPTLTPPTQFKPPSITGRASALGSRSSVPPSTEKAQLDSYRRAAEKGDPNAQMMLGTMYASGKGVPKDLEEAAAWYRKAAEAGNASAQMLLGTCYLYGNGVIKDLSKAVELYRKAAQAGNRMAQYRLGECYAKGQGVPRDDQQAIHWYQKAADQNFSLAKTKLRVLQAKKSPSKPTQAAYISPRNSPVQSQKPASQLGRTNRPTPEDEIGKQAAALKARGDLNGALKLYKEQEKILREKKDIRALNFNLSQQSIILKELLKDIDGKIQDKLNKRRGRG
jgi:WD40 repeat protein